MKLLLNLGLLLTLITLSKEGNTQLRYTPHPFQYPGFEKFVNSFCTDSVSFNSEKTNLIDYRITGTWISSNKKTLYQIIPIPSGGLQVVTYNYQENVDYFLEQAVRIIPRATVVDSVAILEWDFFIDEKGVRNFSGKVSYTPVIYSFNEDGEVIFKKISDKYVSSYAKNNIQDSSFAVLKNDTTLLFKKSNLLKNWFISNHNNPNFFTEEMTFSRYSGDKKIVSPRLNDALAKKAIGVLFGGILLFSTLESNNALPNEPTKNLPRGFDKSGNPVFDSSSKIYYNQYGSPIE